MPSDAGAVTLRHNRIADNGGYAVRPRNENIIAYFQPILSADAYSVCAYEILGRYISEDGTVVSLGDFFHNPAIPKDEALRVDRLVRRYAMLKYVEEKCDKDLFINMRLEWAVGSTDRDSGADEPYTLLWARELGIPPERLIIEITEEEFNSSDAYQHVLTRFTDAGCRIALDDYGCDASNLDRLSRLSPSIIKIDMSYIHKCEESYYYREYLRFLAAFAERVGIEVLCEGVETQNQLDICLQTRSRFYQGYHFAHPQPTMRDAVVNLSCFSYAANKLISDLHTRVSYSVALRHAMDACIDRYAAENILVFKKMDYNAYLAGLMLTMPSYVKRVFLCNRQGDQVSADIESGNIISIKNCTVRQNWIWRNFFQEAVYAFEFGRKSGVTDSYRDIKTKKRIYTYYYAFSSEIFLFADILRMPLYTNKG
jgi:EAL domain-containing protein (putative c-di-GMP-specific phosphodiesterase class I)